MLIAFSPASDATKIFWSNKQLDFQINMLSILNERNVTFII